MTWQRRSDDITHEEYHPNKGDTELPCDIRHINLKKDLPNDWTTTRFVLFLAATNHDGMGYELPNREEWDKEYPLLPDRPERTRPQNPPPLETMPEGNESEEESAKSEKVQSANRQKKKYTWKSRNKS